MRQYHYVPENHPYMLMTRWYAEDHSLDDFMQTAAVVVQDEVVLGIGANGSTYHQEHGCERVRLGIPTGERYDLCEGCSPHNHAEIQALQDIEHAQGACLYLWGHWWCCEDCWKRMEEVGIQRVYLVEGAETRFKRERRSST